MLFRDHEHATAEELQRAHNEGQAWAREEEGRGFVSSLLHHGARYPSDGVGVVCHMNTELQEAFEKGVDNATKK